MENRVFIPQVALDQWMSESVADLRDGELTFSSDAGVVAPLLAIFAAGRRLRLTEAVRIVSEVSGAGDVVDLVGRVKARGQLDEMGAEIVQTSMLVGEAAYDIEPGWLGVPVVSELANPPGT
jgi:hypothetical protein